MFSQVSELSPSAGGGRPQKTLWKIIFIVEFTKKLHHNFWTFLQLFFHENQLLRSDKLRDDFCEVPNHFSGLKGKLWNGNADDLL
jgi:hypothetical protein